MIFDMLKLVCDSVLKVVNEIGYSNVFFVCGYIEDLKIDFDLVDKFLVENFVVFVGDYEEFI